MGLTIAGIIANRVGSAHHAALLAGVLEENQQPPPDRVDEKNAPELPEWHLGLVQPSEVFLPDFLHIEADCLLDLFSETQFLQPEKTEQDLLKNKKIAIARDAACCFIYHANLDFLQDQGTEISYFSPIAGDAIPDNADVVWLPGGYPELFTPTLSVSDTWKSLKLFIEESKPVSAECGRAMLLGEVLFDHLGRQGSMANILPYRSVMQNRLTSLGYREERSSVKGHEFHHSKRVAEQELEPCFQGDQGVRYKNLRASYVHWYFSSASEIITKWLGAI